MKCKYYQALISDEMDGALSEKKRRRLEVHLRGCSGCRAYRGDLLRLQAESRLDRADPVTADYFENFTADVEERIRREVGPGPRGRRIPPVWRWALASVALAGALILAIVLFRSGRSGVDYKILSYEDCLESVYQEIGRDDQSEAEFSQFLSSSLLGDGEAAVLEDGLELWSDPFFWRSLSDEDLQSIEAKIRNGNDS